MSAISRRDLWKSPTDNKKPRTYRTGPRYDSSPQSACRTHAAGCQVAGARRQVSGARCWCGGRPLRNAVGSLPTACCLLPTALMPLSAPANCCRASSLDNLWLFTGHHRALGCEQIVPGQTDPSSMRALLCLSLRVYCDCRVLNGQSHLPGRGQKFFIRGNKDQGIAGPCQGVIHTQSCG